MNARLRGGVMDERIERCERLLRKIVQVQTIMFISLQAPMGGDSAARVGSLLNEISEVLKDIS